MQYGKNLDNVGINQSIEVAKLISYLEKHLDEAVVENIAVSYKGTESKYPRC